MRIEIRPKNGNCEIWLVQDDNPANDRLLATVPWGNALAKACQLADQHPITEIYFWDKEHVSRDILRRTWSVNP